MSDRLDTYRAKRDFLRTAEPQGGVPPMDKPSLMVHKHAARRLHYDFRLEVDGVMPSWAVPKALLRPQGEAPLRHGHRPHRPNG